MPKDSFINLGNLELYRELHKEELEDYVKFEDYSTSTTSGVVKIDGETILIDNSGVISGVGADVSGKSFTIDGITYTSGEGAEVFNDYENNIASGKYSHAEGFGTTAFGTHSHAEGTSTTASGGDSHSEGFGTIAFGAHSHAEGYETTANGDSAHAEGRNTTASNGYSHAEGCNTTASGMASHASGWHTIAAKQGQTAIGWYNIKDTDASSYQGKYAFIIGNGTDDDNRSNALAVTWDGEIESATGKVLSSNDFTDEEKAKLASITNPMVIKGTVSSALDLPTTAEMGWIYFVGADGSSEYDEYVYTENSTWELIGHTAIDMSGYVQTTEFADFKEDVFGVPTPTIASGDDLNNYRTTGAYGCGSQTVATTLLNCPTATAFRLEVKSTGSSARCVQIIYPNTTAGVRYSRNFTVDGWTEWYTYRNIVGEVSAVDDGVSGNAVINYVTPISEKVDTVYDAIAGPSFAGRTNLLEILEKSYTKNGITITCNNDGSITLNGTNTSSGAFISVYDLRAGYTTSANHQNYRLLDSGDYILSGCTANCRIQVFGTDTLDAVGSQIISAPADGSAATFTITDSHKYVYTRLYIAAGASFSNETIYPMIRKADVVDDTWVEAKGSLQFQIDSLRQLIVDNILNGSW